MKTFQSSYQKGEWQTPLPESSDAQLVLAFGSRELYSSMIAQASLKSAFPLADIIGCSTSGEILGDQIYDDSLCITAITWADTRFQIKVGNIGEYSDSQSAGRQLAEELDSDGLKHLFLLSDGQKVNGTRLVEGLKAVLPPSISITGGLAGDGERFEETIVWHNDRIESGLILLCGLYGEALQVGHGCVGGWEVFGPDRVITKAKDNVLYELDGTSALELYKNYLGEHANNLPGSALLFPLHVHSGDEEQGVVRTILSIDEDSQSMTFAGNIPEGDYAQLMHANFDRLIDGASAAAQNAFTSMKQEDVGLAILISCVGRRIVLKQRTDEELEAAQDIFPGEVAQCGFYSYGEVSPLVSGAPCNLHNQSMTITTFSERLNA